MIFIWLFSLFSAFSPSPALATTSQEHTIPYQFKEGFLSIGAEAGMTSTSSNYLLDSSTLTLQSGYAYKLYQGQIYTRYDISNRISFYAEMPIAYAISDDPAEHRTTATVPGLSLGANYDLGLSFVKLILDFRGYLSIEKWDVSADKVQASDGAHKFESGFHLMKRFYPMQLHTYVGFDYRTDGFSGLLKYQGDATYMRKQFSLALGLTGYKSITDDSNVNTPAVRYLHINTVDGGSNYAGSVNPALLSVFTLIKAPVTRAVDMYVSYDQSISGTSNAVQSNLMVGLEYFFDPFKKKKTYQYKNYQDDDRNKQEKIQYEDEKQNKEYENEYEQNIQKFNQPPQRRSVAPAPAPAPAPTTRRAAPPVQQQTPATRVQTKTAPQVQPQETDQQQQAPLKKPNPQNGLEISNKSFGKVKKVKPKRKSKKAKITF